MYITKVSGHRQATVAIKKSLKSLAPDVEIKSINGFSYIYPILEKIVNKAYMGVIKTTPKIWDFLYDNPRIVEKSGAIQSYLHKTSHVKLAKLFNEFQPDTVVCTQAFPCGMIADYKRSYHLNFTLIGVLTDFSAHAYWLNQGVDYYIVPSQEAKDFFLAKGIPGDSIKLYGIPIRTSFTNRLDKTLIAQKIGFDRHIPTILIMGGGQGLGPIRDVVKSLIRLELGLQLIVLAGVNKRLIKYLTKIQKKSKKPLAVYEYTDDVDELMELAALIVTKPGGMTTSEALAKGLPMVIINPIPGQEIRNTNFLIKNGIAIRVDDVKNIGLEIERLLMSPERLRVMSQAAYAHGKPNAAMDISRLILQKN